jgi:hypothetical protein
MASVKAIDLSAPLGIINQVIRRQRALRFYFAMLTPAKQPQSNASNIVFSKGSALDIDQRNDIQLLGNL